MCDTVAEIELAIKERRQLMGEMVGRLYPAILAGEIEELLDKKAKLMKESNREV
jgi:hypothetical protein